MKLRALEYSDLLFVHELNNEYSIMAYWFEEPYESLTELQYLFDKHLLDESERRFIVEDENQVVGIVELVEINYIHRNCEIQIIIKPERLCKIRIRKSDKLCIRYIKHAQNLSIC